MPAVVDDNLEPDESSRLLCAQVFSAPVAPGIALTGRVDLAFDEGE